MENLKTDISFYKGNSKSIKVNVTKVDFDGVETVFNLTGYTAILSVKTTEASTTYLFQLTSSLISEIDIPTPANGIIYINFPPAKTSALTSGIYFYDIQITNGTYVYTIKKNKIELLTKIT